MIIEVCSQNRALEEVTNKPTGELVSVISIVSSDEKDVEFDCKENLCGVLHLKFNDLEKEYDEEGIPYGRPLPKSKDLYGLKEFVVQLSCDRLVVHCYEGTSRSAAVASAIWKFRGGSDTILTHQRFAPNRLVYILACKELGITPGNHPVPVIRSRLLKGARSHRRSCEVYSQ